MKTSIKITLLSVLMCFSEASFSAPITITRVSDLDFGTAFLGDPNKRIRQTNAETSENASFLITGDAGVTFTTTLPDRIWMNHSSSGSRIRVRRFRSTPRNGRIRNSGERLIFVGATRNSIPTNISTGSYAGTFTVTVVY